MYELLAADPDPRVREHLAQNDHAPGDLRDRLVADPDPRVRATVAQWWTQAPEQVRRLLLTDSVDTVRAAACSTYFRRKPHPVPPPDLVPALLADPATRAGAVRHATLDAETATRLAEDQDRSFQQMFDADATTEAVFDQYVAHHLAALELRMLRLDWVTADPLPHVDSPYPCFRVAAAGGELPPEAVAKLLDDEESDVRDMMARRAPHLVDVATAERVDRTFSPPKRVSWRPADHYVFPPEALRRFATDPDPRMRCLAPRDPDLPAALAERLAHDPDQSVRCAIAPHRNLPTPALTGLLADEAERVVHDAAGSPSLPVEEMERLVALAGR